MEASVTTAHLQASSSAVSHAFVATPIPELLSPAGDWDCARAAVENGADAIYFGLERFNARMRAHNFTAADLPKLMEFLHRRGVKGYVTFNTLVFENEMAQAEDYLRMMIAAGVDAAIVQDVGICRLIRRLSPDFPIHVSTQMTITSAQGVAFARELGCNLVVLARECSIKEIERIRAIGHPGNGVEADGRALPLEVFVHGALCVAYSGQCLTSEALGGRSANRGECAQACRLPYELIADGKSVPLGDRKYLLSPQDLAGLEVLPALVKSGVASLKIEGRLKTPEYVANITRIYRDELDRIAGSSGPDKSEVAQARYRMQMAFSRGLYTGWLGGTNNQNLVHARFGKKRGVYLGEVIRVERDSVVTRLEDHLKAGDGVVFDSGHPEETEEGGRVYEIRPQGNAAAIRFGHGDIDFHRIRAGDRIWKTSDPQLDRELRQSYAGEKPRFHRPITIEVHGVAAHKLTVIAKDEVGHVARVESAMDLVNASRQPLTEERLREQFGRLGGTSFRLARLDNHIEPGLMAPVSELNRLRRQLVEDLEAQRAKPPRWRLNELERRRLPSEEEKEKPRTASHPGALAEPHTAELIVLVRTMAQLERAIGSGIGTIYCEFEDPKKYHDAVQMARGARTPVGGRPVQIFVAPPRIFKEGEEWTLKLTRASEPDGFLVRNYDHLNYFEGARKIGDFSLNVANRLAAEYFLREYGLERLTASYDLNIQQLEALLLAALPSWFEVTLHQHIPMFHMEHCLFCAFLSSGTDYTNCGRPCDRYDLKLRDRVGAEHPVKADAGCRNTVFNSRAQTGAEFARRLMDLGVRHFRIEFLNDSPDQVARVIESYRRLLRGELNGAELWRELKLVNQLGVTRGQMAGSLESG
jgi:putative protease